MSQKFLQAVSNAYKAATDGKPFPYEKELKKKEAEKSQNKALIRRGEDPGGYIVKRTKAERAALAGMPGYNLDEEEQPKAKKK